MNVQTWHWCVEVVQNVIIPRVVSLIGIFVGWKYENIDSETTDKVFSCIRLVQISTQWRNPLNCYHDEDYMKIVIFNIFC